VGKGCFAPHDAQSVAERQLNGADKNPRSQRGGVKVAKLGTVKRFAPSMYEMRAAAYVNGSTSAGDSSRIIRVSHAPKTSSATVREDETRKKEKGGQAAFRR